MRKSSPLSTTNAPRATASQPNTWLAPFAPSVPAKNAISMPSNASAVVSLTSILDAVNRLLTAGPREDDQLRHREIPLPQHLHHLLADRAGANYRNSMTSSRTPAVDSQSVLSEPVYQPSASPPAFLIASSTPGHETRAVDAVVADGQNLARSTEQHFLMRHQPRQPHAVNLHIACASRLSRDRPRRRAYPARPRRFAATRRSSPLS